jgi:hypothetical protein
MSERIKEVNDRSFEQTIQGSAGVMMSSWQLIFQQSKVNNGAYDGDRLPPQKWDWPRETWFQTRLRRLRRGQARYAKKSLRQSLQ